MLKRQLILSQFSRQGLKENNKVTFIEVKRALDLINTRNTYQNQFNNDIAEEIWNETDGQTGVLLRDFIETMLRAESILKDRVKVTQQQIRRQTNKGRKNELLDDQLIYSQELRDLISPFGTNQPRQSREHEEPKRRQSRGHEESRRRQSQGHEESRRHALGELRSRPRFSQSVLFPSEIDEREYLTDLTVSYPQIPLGPQEQAYTLTSKHFILYAVCSYQGVQMGMFDRRKYEIFTMVLPGRDAYHEALGTWTPSDLISGLKNDDQRIQKLLNSYEDHVNATFRDKIKRNRDSIITVKDNGKVTFKKCSSAKKLELKLQRVTSLRTETRLVLKDLQLRKKKEPQDLKIDQLRIILQAKEEEIRVLKRKMSEPKMNRSLDLVRVQCPQELTTIQNEFYRNQVDEFRKLKQIKIISLRIQRTCNLIDNPEGNHRLIKTYNMFIVQFVKLGQLLKTNHHAIEQLQLFIKHGLYEDQYSTKFADCLNSMKNLRSIEIHIDFDQKNDDKPKYIYRLVSWTDRITKDKQLTIILKKRQ